MMVSREINLEVEAMMMRKNITSPLEMTIKPMARPVYSDSPDSTADPPGPGGYGFRVRPTRPTRNINNM
jgi:hypothetical protein